MFADDLGAIIARLEDLKTDNKSRELCAVIGNSLLSILADQKAGQCVFTRFFNSLFDAMQQLGLWKSLGRDWAGRRLLQELKLMHQTAAAQSARGSWQQWRRWIVNTLEHHNFIPAAEPGGVSLYLSLIPI